ncbi:MAG: hypothetical protein E6Q78_09630 [Rhodoferax sp.]|nr:MAG: hypothetical protein E6Q78_09630 [Rhodoferax sp.]
MPGTNYVLTGEMTENGKVIVQGALSVFVSEFGFDISVREHVEGRMFRGKTVIVQPFNPRMFLGPAVKCGYQITMQGNRIGHYTNGPLGHPGDGEFQNYYVLTASISGKYRNEGLDIEIAVTTGRGWEVCYSAKEESEDKFDPLAVTVRFLVPKDRLKEFLGLNDNNIKYFMADLDEIA